MTQGFRIEKLRREHPVDGFTCGREELDRFLTRYAFANQQANASQTYLGLHDADIVGFYSLVVGEVAYTRSRDSLSVSPLVGGEESRLAGDRLTIYRKQPEGRWLMARDANVLSPVEVLRP